MADFPSVADSIRSKILATVEEAYSLSARMVRMPEMLMQPDRTQSGEPVTMGFSPYEIPEIIRQEFSYDPESAYQASWGLAGKKD